MTNRRKINWSGLLGGVTLFTGVTVIGSMINEGYETYAIHGKLLDLAVKEDGSTFILRGAGTVEKSTGSLTYTFDFVTRNMLINGEIVGKPVDDFMTFESFSRPAEIEAARKAGCSIAVNVLAATENYDFGLIETGHESDRIASVRGKAGAFLKNHCPAP